MSSQSPAPHLDVPLKERAPGGLGIDLMRRSVDEVVHRVMGDGGSEWVLVEHMRS